MASHTSKSFSDVSSSDFYLRDKDASTQEIYLNALKNIQRKCDHAQDIDMPYKEDIIGRNLIASKLSTGLTRLRKWIDAGRFGDIGYNEEENLIPTVDRAIKVLEQIYQEHLDTYLPDNPDVIDAAQYLADVRDVRASFDDDGLLIASKAKAKATDPVQEPALIS